METSKLGRQLQASTGRNGDFGQTSVRCSYDIGCSLLFSVCALDCNKQVIFLIILTYLNLTYIKNLIFSINREESTTVFKIKFSRMRAEKPTYREEDFLWAVAKIRNTRFGTSFSFSKN